ncbi:MAG: hypothetical protein H6740_27200 [Alphaproteobacteria bacterium]|nr:hypothetical protein [Alphaproteobacteria bacterium]
MGVRVHTLELVSIEPVEAGFPGSDDASWPETWPSEAALRTEAWNQDNAALELGPEQAIHLGPVE